MPSRFSLKRSVEFAETDMAGIMHFSHFFRWMESCETAFYKSLGLPLLSFVPGQVVGWPRIRVSCDYRAPLRFGDNVTVRLLVQKIGTRSVTYAFHFLKDKAVVARGEITAVCVKSDGKGGMVSAPIPPGIRRRLQVAPERALRG
jgi:acyl-CoA thioester hydrolase